MAARSEHRNYAVSSYSRPSSACDIRSGKPGICGQSNLGSWLLWTCHCAFNSCWNINFVMENNLVYNSYRYIYAVDLKHKFLDGMNQEQEQKTRWDLSAVPYDYVGIQVLTCKQQHRCERSLWWLNKQLEWASAYLQCTEVFSLLFLWSRVQFFFTLFLYFLWEKATPLCSKQTAKSKTNNPKQKPTTSVVTGLLSISSIVIKILIGGGKTKNQNDLSQ